MSEEVISPETFEELMRCLDSTLDGDIEQKHIIMDSLMEDVLISLGYGEGVKIFQETSKWYA